MASANWHYFNLYMYNLIAYYYVQFNFNFIKECVIRVLLWNEVQGGLQFHWHFYQIFNFRPTFIKRIIKPCTSRIHNPIDVASAKFCNN